MKKTISVIISLVIALSLASCNSVNKNDLPGSVTIDTQIPDVIGASLNDAASTLTASGFTVGDIKYQSSDKEKDTVLMTDPMPGNTATAK